MEDDTIMFLGSLAAGVYLLKLGCNCIFRVYDACKADKPEPEQDAKVEVVEEVENPLNWDFEKKRDYFNAYATVITLTGHVHNGGKFVGQKRAGKTTVAQILQRRIHQAYDIPQAELLKEIVHTWYPTKGSKLDIVASQENDMFTVRQLYEKMGSFLRKADKDIWCKQAFEKMFRMLIAKQTMLRKLVPQYFDAGDVESIVPNMVFIVSDVRYANELKFWEQFYADNILIRREDKNGVPYDEEKDHSSNAWPSEFEEFDWDAVIENDCDLGDLEDLVIAKVDPVIRESVTYNQFS